MHLNDSTLIISGHKIIAIYFNQFLNATKFVELFNIIFELSQFKLTYNKTFEKITNGIKNKINMCEYKTENHIKK